MRGWGEVDRGRLKSREYLFFFLGVLMDLEARLVSTEVAGVFGAFFGRPDGFGSSDFDRIVDFLHALSIYMGFGRRFY